MNRTPKYHKISQEQAVKVVEFCHDKGFVHTAYFEHAVGNRLDALCSCCSCCCLGIKMWNLLDGAVPLLAPSGYVSEVTDDCNGCGLCADDICHFDAISMDEAGERAVISQEKCMGCGNCADICPDRAIDSRREPSKGDPLDLEEVAEPTLRALDPRPYRLHVKLGAFLLTQILLLHRARTRILKLY